MHNILIVDDNHKRVESLKRYLQATNNIAPESICIAHSIMRAKEYLSSKLFDVILLDIVLPRRDKEKELTNGGVLLLEDIEKDKNINKPSTIIGITAFKESESEYISEFSSRCLTLIHADFNSVDWMKKVSNAIAYSYASHINKNAPESSNVVIAVHGINTYGLWQDRLSELISVYAKNTDFFSYKYGYFSVPAFFFPPLRIVEVYRFSRYLEAHKDSFKDKNIYIVAHSFGTYIVAYALKYFSKKTLNLNIRKIIFGGSVLKSNFNWANIIKKYDLQLVNDCGINDKALLFSQCFIVGTGMAGRVGFYGLNSKRMMNRYFEGGHSLYFKNNNIPSDQFMKSYWLDLFSDKKADSIQDIRKLNTCVRIKETLLGIFGIIKQTSYYAIIIWVFCYFLI